MPELIEIEPAEGKTRFCDVDLAKEVLAGTQQLGFRYCSVIQEKCLPYAVAGRDLAAKAQTGTGKTAAFLASSMTRLLRDPKPERAPKTCRVLVLEPTRELAMQIEKDAQALGKYTGLYCKAIFGGMDYKEQRDSINYAVDILAGTPGRILDYASSGSLLLRVRLFRFPLRLFRFRGIGLLLRRQFFCAGHIFLTAARRILSFTRKFFSDGSIDKTFS